MKFIASALLALAFASSALAADAVKLTRVYEKLEIYQPDFKRKLGVGAT